MIIDRLVRLLLASVLAVALLTCARAVGADHFSGDKFATPAIAHQPPNFKGQWLRTVARLDVHATDDLLTINQWEVWSHDRSRLLWSAAPGEYPLTQEGENAITVDLVPWGSAAGDAVTTAAIYHQSAGPWGVSVIHPGDFPAVELPDGATWDLLGAPSFTVPETSNPVLALAVSIASLCGLLLGRALPRPRATSIDSGDRIAQMLEHPPIRCRHCGHPYDEGA